MRYIPVCVSKGQVIQWIKTGIECETTFVAIKDKCSLLNILERFTKEIFIRNFIWKEKVTWLGKSGL
jgi:hypothetical protein